MPRTRMTRSEKEALRKGEWYLGYIMPNILILNSVHTSNMKNQYLNICIC